MKRMRFLALAAMIALAGTAPAQAQFGLPKVPKIPGVKTEIPGLGDLRNKLLGDDDPLTTAYPDIYPSLPYLDDYKPQAIYPLTELPLNHDYEPLRIPGLFEIPAQSFCLKAGTYPPRREADLYKGDGYQYAPLKGKKAAIIGKLLRSRAAHPEIPQREVQLLLWAIIARTKPADFPKRTLDTAKKLLTDKEIQQLDGGVLSFIPPEHQNKVMENLPPDVKNVLEAENNMRKTLAAHVNDAVAPVENAAARIDAAANLPGQTVNAQGDALYGEMESLAMRVGFTPEDAKNRVPAGRWNYDPAGYFIRLLPRGYSFTLRQVYHPEPLVIKRGADNKIESVTMTTGDVATFTYAGSSLQSATITSRLTKGKPQTVAAASGVGSSSKSWDGIKGDFKEIKTFGRAANASALEADLKDLIALRAQTSTEDVANDFLARAFMSRFAEYATGATAVAYGGDSWRAPVQVAARGSFAVQFGGGGGGFGGSGGGGAGMGPAGSQRLGQSDSKSDQATDRAKEGIKLINKIGGKGGVQKIPLSLATRLANWICDTGAQAANALQGDPPRPDFEEFATFEEKPLPAIDWTGSNISAKRKAAIEAFLTEFMNLNERMRTAHVDLDRMGGAGEAGNNRLQYDQGCLFVAEKRRIGQQMLVVADKALALKAVLESEGAGNETITEEDLRARQTEVATRGFSAEELKAAKAAGATDDEIAETKRAIITGEMIDDIKGTSYNRNLGEMAAGLKELGQYWASLPDPTNLMSVKGG